MKKKITIGIGVVCLAIIVFFEIIHPIFISYDEINCGIYDEFATMIEDEDGNVMLEGFEGEMPSEDSKDYRRIKLGMDLMYTSLIEMESMQIYVKNIEGDNKKYIVMTHDGCFTEGENRGTRLEKKGIAQLYMIVYVGDLDTENQIKDRIEDIVEHTTFEIMYNMQWFGNRSYTWKIKKMIDNYVLYDEVEGEEIEIHE